MGTRGATVTANTVKPDLAIVFEGCPADDTVAEPYMIQTAIHKGPMLRHIDARMITNPASSAMPWIWRRSWASPCRRACAPAALPTARPSICPTRACPSSSSASLCVTSIPTTASRPQRRGERRPAGRRHFGADGRRADQPLLSPKVAPPWGRSFFVDPRKPYHTLSILLLKSAVPPGSLQLIFLLFHTYSRKIAQ